MWLPSIDSVIKQGFTDSPWQREQPPFPIRGTNLHGGFQGGKGASKKEKKKGNTVTVIKQRDKVWQSFLDHLNQSSAQIHTRCFAGTIGTISLIKW